MLPASLPPGAAVPPPPAAAVAIATPPPADSPTPPSDAARLAGIGLLTAALTLWAWGCSPGGAPSVATLASAVNALAARAVGTSAATQAAAAGVAAGCLHTLSGPDHLAALTPLTIGRTHVAAAAMGALWGFGHSLGQLLLGVAMVLLKVGRGWEG